jgi:uncharacterized protein YjbI with pentapeptide repeats
MSQNLNFINQDLRDRSFQGKNLVGADFSGADIRGCNFSHSQLQSANFAKVLTGLSQRQNLTINITSFFMAFMFAGTAMIAAILLITFALSLILGIAQINRETIYWVAIVVIVLFSVCFAIAFTGSSLNINSKGILVTIPISLVAAFMSGFYGSAFTKVLVSGAFNAIASLLQFNIFTALLTFLAIEPLQIFGSLYLFRLAKNASRTRTGTNFNHADLTEASFHSAVLVNCDFSKAITDGVDWEQAKISKCNL